MTTAEKWLLRLFGTFIWETRESTKDMETWANFQNTEERRPYILRKLERNHSRSVPSKVFGRVIIDRITDGVDKQVER